MSKNKEIVISDLFKDKPPADIITQRTQEYLSKKKPSQKKEPIKGLTDEYCIVEGVQLSKKASPKEIKVRNIYIYLDPRSMSREKTTFGKTPNGKNDNPNKGRTHDYLIQVYKTKEGSMMPLNQKQWEYAKEKAIKKNKNKKVCKTVKYPWGDEKIKTLIFPPNTKWEDMCPTKLCYKDEKKRKNEEVSEQPEKKGKYDEKEANKYIKRVDEQDVTTSIEKIEKIDGVGEDDPFGVEKTVNHWDIINEIKETTLVTSQTQYAIKVALMELKKKH